MAVPEPWGRGTSPVARYWFVWNTVQASAVSKRAVVTCAPRPVLSRSLSAPRIPATAHMPVPMSTSDIGTRAGGWPGWPVTDMMPQ